MLGFVVGDDVEVGEGEPVAFAFVGVGDFAFVGRGVPVGRDVTRGFADGDAVGLTGSGVGVMKMTSKEGVGGTGDTNPCLLLTKRYTPPMISARRINGIISIR